MNDFYLPITAALDLSDLRSDLSQLLGPILDNIAYLDGMFAGDIGEGTASYSLQLMEEYIINIPLIDFISFKLGGGAITLDLYFETEVQSTTGTDDNPGETIEPEGFVAILNVEVLTVQVSNDILKPVHADANGIYQPSTDPNEKVEIPLDLILRVNGDLEFDIIYPFSTDYVFTIPPFQIGDTGIIVNIQGAQVDLSRNSNIDAATAAGYPNDFIGFYAETAEVILPNFFAPQGSDATRAKIVGNNLLIGTGGMNGTIGLEAYNGNTLYPVSFGGGYEVDLSAVDITFKQGRITDSNIKGVLKIPGLKDSADNDATVNIQISIDEQGNFSITASEPAGIDLSFQQGGTEIFKLTLKTLCFEKRNDLYALGISGSLDITAAVPGGLGSQFLPGKVEIKKLYIYSNGKIEFEGGVSLLPKPMKMELGPVDLMISNLSLGSHEKNGRKYLFFGFDGSLNVDPGGVDVRGKGIQFFFTNDDGPLDTYLQIARIDVNLTIPGNASQSNALAIIQGYLAMRGADQGNSGATEYKGSISITLPKPGIKATASMAYTPSKPSFLIDLELSLPVPIPLGPTGLGIYGFRGLFGSRYIASKQAVFPDPATAEAASWWEYYKAPTVGINVDKMLQAPGFSLGAGTSIATAADSGRAFSAELFFLLSIPTTILLQGQAAILAQRVDLDNPNDEPPFSAFLGYSDDSITGGFGVNLALPRSNPEVLKVSGAIEMGFFFRNASAWYINIGRDQPETKRIQGRIFDLFNVYAYLMLSGQGIAAGAGAKFHLDKNFLGIVHVKLDAQLDVAGKISFNPQQIGGYVYVAGTIEISVWKFGLGIVASIYLGADAPKPFLIIGKMHVEFSVKLVFVKKSFSFDIELKWERSQDKQNTPLPILSQLDTTTPESSVTALNIATLEPYMLSFRSDNTLPLPSAWPDLNDPAYIIPLDSYIDIKFARSVRPDLDNPLLKRITTLGAPSANTELYPPQKGSSPQVTHDFRLNDLQIKYFNPASNSWDNYDVYAALPVSDFLQNLPGTTNPPIQAGDLLLGSWQASEVPGSYTNLRLLGINPFSFMNQTDGIKATNLVENFGISATTLFCDQPLRQMTCLTWNPINTGTLYPYGQWFFERGLWMKVEIPGAVLPENLAVEARASYPVADITRALTATQTQSQYGVKVDIRFPEPVTQYTIKYLVDPCSDDSPQNPFVSFIGGAEVIDIEDNSNYHNEDSFTYELWMKPDADPAYIPGNPQSTYVGVLTKYIDDTKYVRKSIQLNATKGAIGGELYNLDFRCTIELKAQNQLMTIESRFIVPDEWLHLCITSSGNPAGDLHIYVNGVEGSGIQSQFTNAAFSVEDNLAPIKLGMPGYKGWMDSFRMYGRPLTLDEITTNYRGNRCYDTPTQSNLLGWWKMNEQSGTLAPDSTSFNNPANLENFSLRTQSGGGAWLELSCDGTNHTILSFDNPFERLVIPDHSAYNFSSDFTLEAWIYVPDLPEYHLEYPWGVGRSFILKGIDYAPDSFPTQELPGLPINIHIQRGDMGNGVHQYFFVIIATDQADNSKSYYMSATFQMPDEWIHFILRKSGTSCKDWDFLINGEYTTLRYDSDPEGTIQVTDLSSSGPLYVGDLYGSYSGKIDMLRLFNRALTDTEIRSSYASGRCNPFAITNDLVGYWPLDQLEGETTSDITPNNNAGTLVGYDPNRTTVGGGAWQFVPCDDIAGEEETTVLSFDFYYERMVIPQHSAYQLSNDFTIEAWIYSETNPEYSFEAPWLQGHSFMIKAFSTTVASPGDYLSHPLIEVHINKGRMENGLYEHYFIVAVVDASTVANFYTSAKFWLPDDWYHLALRKKGTTVHDWEFLVNGTYTTVRYEAVGNSGFTDITNLDSEGPILMGSVYGGFFGKVDLLRLFNRALTDTEIISSYQQGRCNPLDISNGLVGYWPLNELEGEIAPDISPNNNAGSLVGYDPNRTIPGGGAWQITGCSCLHTLHFDGGEEDTRDSAQLSIYAGTTWFKLSIMEICWETLTTNSFNIQQTAINDNRALTLASLAYGMQNVVQPIWRPNTYFAIQISGEDIVDGTATAQEATYGFRTMGPVGHFLQYRPAAESQPDTIDSQKLSSLKPYIDFLHSYPNADGNIINAKPLYYKQGENDLLLFFTFPAIYNMFRDWPALGGLSAVSSSFNILVVENVDQSSPTLPQNWVQSSESSSEADAQVLHNLAVNSLGEGVNCDQFTFNLQQNYHFSISPPDLKPLTLYSAIINADQDNDQEEIYRYVFQTSRYGNFSEQILSYLLSAGKTAIFTVSLVPFDMVKAAAILSGSLPATDSLVKDFAHPFDRLIRGALRLNTLSAAVTTEFTILKDTGTGNIIGMLVRNPEPFNDPKLPDAVRQDSVMAQDAASQSLITLFSKDGAQIFVSNSQLNIVGGSISIVFQQKIYDGTDYVNHNSTVPVIITF